MIFTRWGDTVTIAAYCGKRRPVWASHEKMLVRVQYADGSYRYAYAVNLKADDGINEIEDAIDAVPMVELTGSELRDAMKEAE